MMTEDRLRSTISGYPDIIEGVEELEIIQKNMVSRLKAKLRLFEGSVLLIREIQIKGEMTASCVGSCSDEFIEDREDRL